MFCIRLKCRPSCHPPGAGGGGVGNLLISLASTQLQASLMEPTLISPIPGRSDRSLLCDRETDRDDSDRDRGVDIQT